MIFLQARKPDRVASQVEIDTELGSKEKKTKSTEREREKKKKASTESSRVQESQSTKRTGRLCAVRLACGGGLFGGKKN